jgi:hypothetical protein
MSMVAMLYCLGNNARKSVCACVQYRHNFFPNIFDPWLVESMSVELMEMEIPVYFYAQISTIQLSTSTLASHFSSNKTYFGMDR